MNKICNTCDTKNRLNICNGRDGDFKYCFRKCGNLDGVFESITPFNNIEELYNCEWFNQEWRKVKQGSLHVEDYSGEHIGILLGQYEEMGETKDSPKGFVIK